MKKVQISEKYALSMYLFVDVKNCKEFKGMVLSKKFRSLCLIDPRTVMDDTHVVLAANKACHAVKMKSRDIHTELLYNLGISRNIGACLTTFGLKDDNQSVIVCGFNMSEEEDQLVKKTVLGELVDFSRMNDLRDINTIKKLYQIESNDIQVIRKIAVSKIATRDI